MLSQAQIDRFHEQGYLVVEGALTDEGLNPVVEEYNAHIDARALELHAEGKISELFENEPFERRLATICKENTEIFGGLDIMRLRGKATFDFLHNERLLDVVEGIVGPEITCSPIQHIRAKLPHGISPTNKDVHVRPWHQDAGVTLEEADPYLILTVWIPLVDATPENGCLEVLPRVQGTGLLRHHRVSTGTAIVPEEMPNTEGVPLPVRKGDLILMHKETPHRSTLNLTDGTRWSMDLRYQKTGTPTGRPFYPDFMVRSRANPDLVLTDHATWCRMWIEALEKGKGIASHRWQ